MPTNEERSADILAKYTGGGGSGPSAPAATSGEDPRAAEILAKYVGQAGSSPAMQVEQPVEDQITGADYAAGLGKAGLQGLTLNLSDEIGSGAIAAWESLTGGDDFSDVYDQEQAESKRLRDAFAAENPKAALAAEIAGGLGTGVVGGGKVLASKLGQGLVNKIGQLGAVSAVGAGDAAISGFGAGETLDERLQGAAVGGTIGAALPSALTGIGKGVTKAAERIKLPNALNGQHIGISNPDSRRGQFTNQLLGNAITGRSIRQQNKDMVEKARLGVEDVLGSQRVLKDEAKKAIDDEALALRTSSGIEKTALKDAAKEEIAAARGIKFDLDAKRNTALGGKLTMAKERAAAATAQADTAFREKAATAALPANAEAETRKAVMDLQATDPRAANALIDKYWLDNGFDSAKEVSEHVIEIAPLKASMKKLFSGDPALRDAAGKEWLDKFDTAFVNASKGIDRGYANIKGEELLELRNSYARSANGSTDPLERTSARAISNNLDDVIRKGIKDAGIEDGVARFDDDLAKYGGKVQYGKAVEKAVDKKQGLFAQDEYLKAAPKKLASKNKARLQADIDEAQTADLARKVGLDKTIAKLKGGTATRNKELSRTLGVKVKDINGVREKDVAKLATELTAKLKSNPVKTKYASKSEAIAEELRAAKDAKTKITATSKPTESSFLTQLAATAVLGSAGFAAGGGLGVGGGLGLGASLSSQKGQRMLAGEWVDSAVKSLTPSSKALVDELRLIGSSTASTLAEQ